MAVPTVPVSRGSLRGFIIFLSLVHVYKIINLSESIIFFQSINIIVCLRIISVLIFMRKS